MEKIGGDVATKFLDLRAFFSEALWLIFSFLKSLAVRRPGVVAEPAETLNAFAEFLRDGRREPGVDVFQAALPGVAFGSGVERQEALPAFSRRAGARIEQEIGFCGEPQKCCAKDLGTAGFLLAVFYFLFGVTGCENKLGDKERVAQIRQGVVETLSGVDGAQCG